MAKVDEGRQQWTKRRAVALKEKGAWSLWNRVQRGQDQVEAQGFTG